MNILYNVVVKTSHAFEILLLEVVFPMANDIHTSALVVLGRDSLLGLLGVHVG
jgi:hypothetical protein